MLSNRSFYNSNNNYEADEIQSSSSSSLSFENNESFSYNNYYNHYQRQETLTNHTIMDEQHHQTDLTFHDSDWSMNKSPQPSFIQHRDDLYSPVGAPPPSYSSYDNNSYEPGTNNFPDATTMTPIEPVYHHMSWPTASNDDHSTMANMMGVANTPAKLDSPEFFLHNKKQPHFNNSHHHIMNIFPPPSPPPLPHHQPMNMFCQRPNHTLPQQLNKGDKYHPRFKSANARLSPFTEQQEMYQQLLTSSSSSSPPQHHHSLMEDQIVKEENNSIVDQQQQFYHNYQVKKEYSDVETDQTSFQFDVVLHASTAVKKKHDEQSVTYLNRGQAYLIDLSANSQQQQQYPTGTMTGTLSIAFHEPSHRQIAENYWKYWISQQETPKEARAIDLDTNQTTGVYNIRLVSFDRVSFDWHSRFGAKVYVRFNCLSTDFSRIKGVKGIPLRCVMETNVNYMTLPNDSMLYRGSFQNIKDRQEVYQYKELCYCKIKLFRDKGAERKNKDDKKQMAKQMEKVIASTNGNPQQHPLWPIISQTHKSTSVLSEVPSSPDVILDDFDETASLINIMAPTTTTTTKQSKRKRTQEHKSAKKEATTMELAVANDSPKKSRNKSTTTSAALCFYVWTRHIHSTPHKVYLDQLTTQDLKSKLGAVLLIHPTRISEILWKRKKSDGDNMSDVLVLVEDTFIAEHIVDGEMMTVDLEIKPDGNLRLVLEF